MRNKEWIEVILGTKPDQTLRREIDGFIKELAKDKLPKDPARLLTLFDAFADVHFSCRKKTGGHTCSTCPSNEKALDRIEKKYEQLLLKHSGSTTESELQELFSNWLEMHILCLTGVK